MTPGFQSRLDKRRGSHHDDAMLARYVAEAEGHQKSEPAGLVPYVRRI